MYEYRRQRRFQCVFAFQYFNVKILELPRKVLDTKKEVFSPSPVFLSILTNLYFWCSMIVNSLLYIIIIERTVTVGCTPREVLGLGPSALA